MVVCEAVTLRSSALKLQLPFTVLLQHAQHCCGKPKYILNKNYTDVSESRRPAPGQRRTGSAPILIFCHLRR